jgi:hypothetical protein
MLDKRPGLHVQIEAARHRDNLSHGTAPIKAWQRKIADKARKTSKRERLTSLNGAYIGMIEREQAKSIILKFEWLGNIGVANKFVGLFTVDHELIGVACFGHGPAPEDMRKLLGGPALCLERGACVPHAPSNAASFLISHACKWMYQTTGISRFFAYGDPEAGEYGAVYQASNWIYLGQGLMGVGKDRKIRRKVLRPGDDPKNPQNWKTTRELRRPGKKPMSFAEALKRGWLIEKRPAKHVYAVNVGEDAKRWRVAHGGKPYPKPRPELTRKALDTGPGPF